YRISSTIGDRRWISSMKRTSRGSRFVRIAARSPGRSSTGPEVCRKPTPSSFATICASVVLPSPGGPNSSTWSSASCRSRAAWMKISNCDFTFACPTYSASESGRSERSICSSWTDAGLAEISRSVSMATSGFCQSFQCRADAVGDGDIGCEPLDGRVRFFFVVAERKKRIQDVRRFTAGQGHRTSRRNRIGKLPFQLEQQALRGLLADARDLRQAPRLLQCHGLREVGD